MKISIITTRKPNKNIRKFSPPLTINPMNKMYIGNPSIIIRLFDFNLSFKKRPKPILLKPLFFDHEYLIEIPCNSPYIIQNQQDDNEYQAVIFKI